MMAKLREFISSNIFLYNLWFIFVRKRNGLDIDFFQRDTDVYLDGYPRSGNTFIIHLVRRFLPPVNIVHHLHAIAPIKIALLLKLPVFILIRNPMDCISSKYLKHFSMRDEEVDISIDERLLNQFILDYLTYYQFVKDKQCRLTVIEFDQLIRAPEIILNKIQDRLGLEKQLAPDDISNAVRSYKGATNTMGSSLPNPKKEQYKSIVKESILQAERHDDLLKLYDSITNQL